MSKRHSSDSEEEDPQVSELMRRNREITKLKQKRAQEKAEKEARRAEEMKKWVDEQDKKRKEDMDEIINKRQKALQDRHKQLQKKRQEREEFRRKQKEEALKKPASHQYVYRRMEKDFQERFELPELRRQQDLLEQRRKEIRSVDIGRLQKEGELAILEQRRRQEQLQMRSRASYSAADASTSDKSSNIYRSKYHDAIERERLEKVRQAEERDQQKREAILRRQQYGRIVRDVFIPPTDERLQNELEDRIRKLDAMKKSALQRLEEGQVNNPLSRVDLSTIFADRLRPGHGDTGRSSLSYQSSLMSRDHPYGVRAPYRRGQQNWSP